MSITSITLGKAVFMDLAIGQPELPLEKDLEMRSLGRVVLLAGPNGAGKSRVLRLVPKLLQKLPSAAQRATTRESIRLADERIDAEEQTLVLLEGSQSLAVPKKHEEDVQAAKNQIAATRIERERLLGTLKIDDIIGVDTSDVPMAVEFVPQVPVLQNPLHYTDGDVTARAKQMARLGSQDAEQSAPAYLRETMKAALRARLRQEEGDYNDASKRQAELLGSLRKLLGPQFSLDLDNSFNLAVGASALDAIGLSHGQQVLVQFACLLHAQGQEVGDCVILMDEPENHLHPAVINDVIDALQRNLRTGQLWIATHSVPLIAHLVASDPDCLWLVESGHVQSAKRSPELVLHSLMGGPDGAKNLHDFTLLPAQYAALRFMAQCLEPPGVAGADVNDPQTKQIRDLLVVPDGATLHLLDFGAGKGRLLTTLAAGPAPAANWLHYEAFEPYAQNDAKELLQAVSAVYSDAGAATRVHLNQDDLRARVDKGSVDVVVMCNVLHELSPQVWLDWFGPTGEITRLLKAGGQLLLVEDYGLPVGERAHEYGFLLLDEPELVALFDIQRADREAGRFVRSTVSNPSFRDRLVAFAIDRTCVERATPKSVHSAITTLKDRTFRAVSNVLANPVDPTSKEGRAYARNAQLHTNAQIWVGRHPLPA